MANDLKDIIKDFKNLASKIQTDNSNVKQHLKDKNLMLEACQKEYQKIYFEHENLKKIYQQLEEQLKQQQRLIKKLPQHIKNKKRYFITDDSEDYDENIDDCKNENDDDYDDDDDDDNNEVEYIKVKKKQIKKTFNRQKKSKKSTKRNNRLYK